MSVAAAARLGLPRHALCRQPNGVRALHSIPQRSIAGPIATTRISNTFASRQIGRLSKAPSSPKMALLGVRFASSERSGPTQQQIREAFGTPFLAFFKIVGRIARTFLLVGGTIVVAGAIFFEGMHTYIEHVAMPRSQVKASFLDYPTDVKAAQDDIDWGWAQEMSDESWSGRNVTGTDPRLGWRARHLVRAAWANANWGGGLLPESMFRPRSHAHIFTDPFRSGPLHEDEGTESAIGYLDSALRAAEDKGIRLPDMAAIRAGLSTPAASNVRASENSIDETALALEMKHASLMERQGTQNGLRGCIAGYTRVYDVLSDLDATNRAMKSVGRASGQPSVRRDRLVRLATRIGNAHANLGNIEQAEAWLLRAVASAGEGATIESNNDDGSRAGIFHNEILSGKSVDQGQLSTMAMPPPEQQEAKGTLQTSNSGDAANLAVHPVSPADAPPSPALTRSLISSLLALSALNAKPQDRTRLEKALQFQASALRLIRTEVGRLSLSDPVVSVAGGDVSPDASSKLAPMPAQLHSLWLAHHDGLASVHVAETMFALGGGTAAKVSSAVRGMLSAIGLGGSKPTQSPSAKKASASSSATEQTLAWLEEAKTRATAVSAQLGKSRGRQSSDELALLKKWAEQPVALSLPASRLLRDSARLSAAAADMQSILAAKNNK